MDQKKCGIYIDNGVFLSHRNNGTWFEGKRKQLEYIMLSEVSQAQKDKSCMFSVICGK
jgi:hypothetical protein